MATVYSARPPHFEKKKTRFPEVLIGAALLPFFVSLGFKIPIKNE
jgi:hypothetical protein